MGGRFECLSSSSSVLLCAEDHSSFRGLEDDDDDESGGVKPVGCQRLVGFDVIEQRKDLYGESLTALPPQSDECVRLLASRETEHLPKGDYAKRLQGAPLILSTRREAVEWIEKVHAYYNFGPTTAYLSVNYLDRFLSCYELPQGKNWMTQLLAVACLSLAAKMEEPLVPLSLDLQVCEPRYIFEAKTIQRMELLVLSTLQWRMHAVTPFSYVDYFLCKFSNVKSLVPFLPQSFEVIKNTIRNVDFLEFRPSQIALAVTLFVTSTGHTTNWDKPLSLCFFVDMEGVMRCYDMIKDIAFLTSTFKCPSGSFFSASQDPSDVLDGISNNSDAGPVGSQLSTCYFSPDAKRRRLYGLPI